MGIKQEIEHTKTLLNQGVDLLLLRLQVINIDLAEQAENAFRTLLALLFSAVLLFVALFAALFGLNRLLDDATAVKVFFIAAAGCCFGGYGRPGAGTTACLPTASTACGTTLPACAANCPKARPVMNKERKQARELLELEIKLARLKVTAAQIRQEKTRQQRKKQRVDFVQLAEIAAAAASEGWAQKAAFSAARGKSRWALIAAWLAWHFMRRKG